MLGVTQPRRCRCDETEHTARPTHLAPSCTLAQPAALPHAAGGLLPHRFTPYRHSRSGSLAGLLSVAVVVTLRTTCPHLLFREATLPTQLGGLGVGKFLCPVELGSDGSPRLPITHRFLKCCTLPGARRPRQDSNLRPQRPQRCALSPELRGLIAKDVSLAHRGL